MSGRRIDWERDDLGAPLADLRANPGTSGAEMAGRFGVSGGRAVFWLTCLQSRGYAVQFHLGPGRRGATSYRWWPVVNWRVLGELEATDPVLRLVELAAAGNLHPQADPDVSHGAYRVYLNGEGRDAPSGSLRISARKGTLLGASLMWPGAEVRYRRVAETQQALASWLSVVRGRGGRGRQ